MESTKSKGKGKRFAVTYVDYGESCDWKPRFQGLYDTKAEALAAVHEDMDEMVENADGRYTNVDKGGLSVWDENREAGCEWNIEEVA